MWSGGRHEDCWRHRSVPCKCFHCFLYLTCRFSQANKYPWMVALVSSGGFQFCGGTLVSSKYVISAAHCMFDQNGPISINQFQVR